MKTSTITIGEFVRREREKVGMSIKDVSTSSGLSTSTISETENNIHTPRVSTLMRMLNSIEEQSTT